jgi:hypothetical protein
MQSFQTAFLFQQYHANHIGGIIISKGIMREPGNYRKNRSTAGLSERTVNSAGDKESSYQAEVNAYFQDVLSDFNNRKVDEINTHLQTIKDAFTKENIGSINLVYGGSTKKHTYVDGLSDVDVLATIDNTALADASPRQVLQYFAEKLEERLPNTEIKIGNLAVTVKFSDGHEIQVLPALSAAGNVRIPSGDSDEWSSIIKPGNFANKLTTTNQSNSGKVIPAIKLYKAINAGLPKESQLSGYHIEALAIDAFKNYNGSLEYKDMLLHLVQHGVKAVQSPIRDSTGQSVHVDDYLGSQQSDKREKAINTLENVATRMRSADSQASLEKWIKLVEE